MSLSPIDAETALKCINRSFCRFFLLRHLRNNLRAMIARMAWMFGGRNVAMGSPDLGFWLAMTTGSNSNPQKIPGIM